VQQLSALQGPIVGQLITWQKKEKPNWKCCAASSAASFRGARQSRALSLAYWLSDRCSPFAGCLRSGPLHNPRLFTSALRAPQIAANSFCLAKMRLRQLGRRLRRALECTSPAVSHWPSVKNLRQLAFACAELSKRTGTHSKK